MYSISIFRRFALACVVGATLASCAEAPATVHFFADGRPEHLSDWRVLLVDRDALRLNAGVTAYDLNTPLFSDYAHKLRTVWMPNGAAAKYDANAAFDFPVGTIITKTFDYPLPQGGAAADAAVARTYDTA